MGNFVNDISFGQKYEKIARDLCTEEVTEIAVGRVKEYDFKTVKYSYEVKADRWEHKYQNKSFFIEYECSGKPSGISSTKADYWFYFMVHPSGQFQVYRLPVDVLKQECKTKMRSVCGGDGGRSRGHIVSINNLLSYRIKTADDL